MRDTRRKLSSGQAEALPCFLIIVSVSHPWSPSCASAPGTSVRCARRPGILLSCLCSD